MNNVYLIQLCESLLHQVLPGSHLHWSQTEIDTQYIRHVHLSNTGFYGNKFENFNGGQLCIVENHFKEQAMVHNLETMVFSYSK